LPGGGVEKGESLEEAVKRECLEEIGCNVEVDKEIGFTKEFRLKTKRKQETHCFVVKVIGDKGNPTSKQEDEVKAKLEWMDINDALTLLKKNKETISPLSYSSQFNIRSHTIFLEEYLKKENHR
jgi:8-oxo-dGTP diphosphatase